MDAVGKNQTSRALFSSQQNIKLLYCLVCSSTTFPIGVRRSSSTPETTTNSEQKTPSGRPTPNALPVYLYYWTPQQDCKIPLAPTRKARYTAVSLQYANNVYLKNVHCKTPTTNTPRRCRKGSSTGYVQFSHRTHLYVMFRTPPQHKKINTIEQQATGIE